MTPVKPRKKPNMSDEHLRALANGRSESAVIKRYLVAIENHKPRRGRKRTTASVERRLAAIENQLHNADPLVRVQLIQERMNLEQELQNNSDAVDMRALEEGFVRAAKTYGERKGITYAAWREFGVDAAILKKSGINRTN